jgi:hypothetical protein
VDLMHVLHRPHLLRLISVTVLAAILAIAISLAFARSLSAVSQPSDNPSSSTRNAAPVPATTAQTSAPRWASNPFASLLSRPLARPWPTARR